MATDFTLLDHLKPCIHVLCLPCIGVRKKRQRQSVDRDSGSDEREYDPWERQGLLDNEEGTTSRGRNFADDEDAMSLHSNLGRNSHGLDTDDHSYPHFPLHSLTRWQLLTSWFDVRGYMSRQPVSLPADQDQGPFPDYHTSATARSTSNHNIADDEERREAARLEEAVKQAKLSAREKCLKQTKAEGGTAEHQAAEEHVDWGPMQYASLTVGDLTMHLAPGSSRKEQHTSRIGPQTDDIDTDDSEGIPDLAEEGGLFSSPAGKAKRKDSSSSSGRSSKSLSSSGTSARQRRVYRERSGRALSDTVSNVTQEDYLPSFGKLMDGNDRGQRA